MAIRIYIGLLIITMLPSVASAWNLIAHQVIGYIAYDHLNTDVKSHIHDTLEGFVQGDHQQRFVNAMVWPDKIKLDGINDFNTWHYINEPYSADGTPTRSGSTENILSAFFMSVEILTNPNALALSKAKYLALLIHFVADAHQPLHCINYFSELTPDGDRGGNLYFIDDEADNLHRLWDQGLGLFALSATYKRSNNEQIRALAEIIQKHYPREVFLTAIDDLSVQNWVDESYLIARDFGYNVPMGGKPQADYITQGHSIVAQRAALAGYRLANLLNALY